MNMHMGRNVQTTGMGMQQRHQTLQECQNQKQAVIQGIFSHARILILNTALRQFFGSRCNRFYRQSNIPVAQPPHLVPQSSVRVSGSRYSVQHSAARAI